MAANGENGNDMAAVACGGNNIMAWQQKVAGMIVMYRKHIDEHGNNAGISVNIITENISKIACVCENKRRQAYGMKNIMTKQ